METTKNCLNSKKRKLSETEYEENDGSIEAQLEAMKAENEKLKQMIEKQNATIIDLAMDNTELKKVKLNQSNLIKEYEAEINHLKPVVDDLKNKNSKLLQREIKAKYLIVKYKSRVDCMQYDLVAAKVVGDQIQSNLKRNYESKIAQLESSAEKLIKKNFNLNQTLENERKMFKAKLNGFKSIPDDVAVMKENIIPVAEFLKKLKDRDEEKCISDNVKIETDCIF